LKNIRTVNGANFFYRKLTIFFSTTGPKRKKGRREAGFDTDLPLLSIDAQ